MLIIAVLLMYFGREIHYSNPQSSSFPYSLFVNTHIHVRIHIKYFAYTCVYGYPWRHTRALTFLSFSSLTISIYIHIHMYIIHIHIQHCAYIYTSMYIMFQPSMDTHTTHTHTHYRPHKVMGHSVGIPSFGFHCTSLLL